MEKLRQIVSHQWFVPCVALLLFSLLVLFAGPYIAFAGFYPLATLGSRWFLIFAVIFIYVGVKLARYYMQVRAQQQLVKDITDEENVSDVIDAESSELKEKFQRAFARLKGKKGGAVSLTELPWYIIIGSPGSGKTTLLSNSGLRFPLRDESSAPSIQGVGGTKNCDWWITQDAILLDTAGRYASQDSHRQVDESGWFNFLGLIKKYRKKPISGLLVSVSMTDLLTMNQLALNQHVSQLKHRIAEVNEFFNTRFPVYIIVTKSDMLAGFSQFFETFSHKEREQTLGITFDSQSSMAADVTAQFSEQFDLLAQSIKRRQWQRMALERDPSRKGLLFGFTEQFSSLKSQLADIVDILANLNDGVTAGIVRGVYFTSGTQHGAPIDRMIGSIASALGFRHTANATWNNDQRSYFIKELMEQVVFTEADQFGVLAGYKKRKLMLKRSAMAAAAVLAVGLSVGMLVSYNNNSSFIALSEASVDDWQAQYDSLEGSNVRRAIPALNEFATNINSLSEQHEAHFSGLGLSQASSLERALTASYMRLLKSVLLPYVKEQAEFELNNADSVQSKYQALKAYLMLYNEEQQDQRFLIHWLTENLNGSGFFSEAEYAQVVIHAQNMVRNNLTFEEIDQPLVDDARSLLRAQPLADIYYLDFKSSFTQDKERYLSMAELAGSDWRALLDVRQDDILTISELYTPAEFETVTDERIDSFVDGLDDAKWILGEDLMVDKGALKEGMQLRYADDYINSWNQLLNDIQIKPVSNASSLNTAISLSGRVDSPILKLLQSVSSATRLVEMKSGTSMPDLSVKGNGAISQARKMLERHGMGSLEYYVTSKFAPLHEMTEQENMTVTQQRLQAATSEVAMKLNLHLNNGNAVTAENLGAALEGFAYSHSDPLRRWSLELAGNVKQVQNQFYRIALDRIWQQDVRALCAEAIGFKYPFEHRSQSDATLQDFSVVFGPDGAVYQFFEEYLQPLLRSRSYPWSWRDDVEQTYGFDEAVLPFFENVSKVQSAIYASGGGRPSLQLQLTPVSMDNSLAKVRLSAQGKVLTYQFGRTLPTPYSWPAQNPEASSRFTFIRRDNSEIVESQQGLFSLFRLMGNRESIKSVDEKSMRVTFAKGGFTATYEVSATGSGSPMVMHNLEGFSCLSKL